MIADKAYLSILDWPDAMDDAARAAAIARSTGLDAYQAGLAVKRGFPQVVLRMDPPAADRAADLLHAAGATAVAPRQSEMAAQGLARRVKSLSPALGAPEPLYACEMWRDEPDVLRPRELALIVRGTVVSTERRVSGGSSGVAGPASYALAGIGGAMVAAAMDSTPTTSTKIRTAEILDLYPCSGGRLRIDSDKFNFEVLGPVRGVSDRESMSRLVERLRREAPRALYDDGFAAFRCPPDTIRTHFIDTAGPAVRKTDQAPAFEFYSTWVAMMYKTLGAF